MQALVLAGGEGTRLRPLTVTVPKPVLPLVNRPFISYMIDWLASHGVDDVVMSCGFLADQVRATLGDGDENVRVRYVEEDEPLGTAGAVKHAEHLLGDRFAVLNGDVLADWDLSGLFRSHEELGATATIALKAVDDPSAYGLVRLDGEGRIREFLEKPEPHEIDTDLINAGAYVLERRVLDRIEAGRQTSFEREVFPSLVGEGLYGIAVDGYWLDIGTPARYLEATFDILEGKVHTALTSRLLEGPVVGDGATVAPGATLATPVVVGEGARVEDGAAIGPRTAIGPAAAVGESATVESASVHERAQIGESAVVTNSIVGAEARIGAGARVEAGAVIGPGAAVEAGSVVAGEWAAGRQPTR